MADKSIYIRYFAAVDENNVKKLLQVVEQKLKEGATRFVLLMSSSGGSVFYGLSAYNFLKGIPAEVVTHNFGGVDSMAAVVYCAGSKRLCVPHARFMLHPPRWGTPGPVSLDEKQLEEGLKGLRVDMENMAGVIAATANKSESQVHEDMLQRTTLSPEEAIAYGLVTEIKTELFEPGAEVIAIE